MKRLPFYFWVSLALASCQGGKEAVNQALPVIDMNEDYPEKEIVLQDIADISYIPLETNDEFLFDGSVEVVTDQYVITKGHRGNDVCFFSRQGKALNRIHRVGNGPGEYKDIGSIDVNPANGELYLKEMNRQQIHVYSLDGKFKHSFTFPEGKRMSRMCLFSPDYLIAEQESKVPDDQDANFYPYLLVSTRDGHLDSLDYVQKRNILVKLIVNAENHSYAYLLEPSLIRNGSRFYIGNPDSDTLFAMNPDRTLEPLLVRTPSHSEEGNKYGLFLRGAAVAYFFLTKQPMEVPMNSIESFDLKSEEWLYDCRTQEVCRYLLKNKDDASKRVEGIMFFCYPEDCGLAVLKSEDLMDAYEAGQLSGELKEIAAGLKADDNPVLMLIHFKK